MPLKQKKKKIVKTGAAKNYITRTQAVRKLQISLADFRRLCIFKGIYPREPRNKNKVKKGSTPATTFYYARDIQYLLHEPLLAKFRDHKALAKKIGRLLGRNEVGDAARMERNASRMTLDHLVKERYPTFVDALRDLDDALTMLFLFASLPSTSLVPPKTIALCQRLCLEFQHYIIVSRSLRKSFLSIKGIYYQATIQGQDILWLVPYKFVQKAAGDIDFRIMATFIEFYTTLMGFVNYRLYTTIGLVYPPKFDALSDEKGGELGAFKLQGRGIAADGDVAAITNGDGAVESDTAASKAAQAAADQLIQSEDPETTLAQEKSSEVQETANEALDSFKPVTSLDADVLTQPTFDTAESGKLFSNAVFFLSRECPKGALEFVLRAFGCSRIGWDAVLGDGAWTTDERDPRITHQIVDRPPLAPAEYDEQDADEDGKTDEEHAAQKAARAFRMPGRIYVQPQWVWDCINQSSTIRPDLYAPGASLPPHLSPWVKPKAGVYDPTRALAEQEKEHEAALFEEDARNDAQRAIEASSADGATGTAEEDDVASEDGEDDDEIEAGEGMQVDLSGDEDEEDESEEASSNDEQANGDDDQDDTFSGSEDEAAQYQRELEAEAAGLPVAAKPVKNTPDLRRQKLRQEQAAKEELDRQRMMMSNKKRKLFDKMQFSNKKADREAEKLRQKRRKIEAQRMRAET